MIRAAFFDIDGTLMAHNLGAVPEDTLQALQSLKEKGIHVFTSTGRHILEGDFDCRPYLLGQSGGCDYCDYHSICGFDRKLEGYQCRRLEQLSNEEIMAKIEKELEEGGKEDGDDVDGGSAEGH